MSKVKTPAKRTTKNKNKVRKALGWFKPTTPLKGMLLFALVFASIGGGILVYQSYASNTSSWWVHVKANTIIKGAYINHCYIQYMGGTLYGDAYTTARVRSTNGKPCRLDRVGVWNTSGGPKEVWDVSAGHSSKDWSTWRQVTLGSSTFVMGRVIIRNMVNNNTHTVNFTVYY